MLGLIFATVFMIMNTSLHAVMKEFDRIRLWTTFNSHQALAYHVNIEYDWCSVN